jgi:hypothetical protein
MDTGLGLLGIAGFIVGTIALSAGVTWLVVRVDAVIRKSRT